MSHFDFQIHNSMFLRDSFTKTNQSSTVFSRENTCNDNQIEYGQTLKFWAFSFHQQFYCGCIPHTVVDPSHPNGINLKTE